MPLTIPPSSYANQIRFTSVYGLAANEVNSAIDEVYAESAKLGLDNTFTEVITLINANTATSTTTGALKLPGIGMGNGNIYLTTPPTSDNTQRVPTTQFVNNYISRGLDSGNRQYIRFGNSSNSGLLVKFGTTVVNVSSNTATVTYGGTPGFASVLSIVACNGDSGATDSPVHVQSWNNTGFTIRTPSFTGATFRVNWIAFGVPA